MKKPFYRAFEDRYRGSAELITDRLQVYQPFLAPLLHLDEGHKAIDLGCGRGEWMSLLTRLGFAVVGVDLDEGMLEECRLNGFDVENTDAIDKLQSLPDSSQVLVSGFHLAEHIPFDSLQTLVAEALRVLVPGGLLILETPNAENLVVGTNNFYLDPSHERPVPSLLLSFLVEYEGFGRNTIMRLQEPSPIPAAQDMRMLNVFHGVSQDYAVVAQKPAPQATLALFDSAFDREYGVTLDALAERYETKLQTRFDALEQSTSTHYSALEQVREVNVEFAHSIDRFQSEFFQLKKEVDGLDERAGRDRSLQHQLKADIEVLGSSITQLDQRLSTIEQLLREREARTLLDSAKAAVRPVALKTLGVVLRNPTLRTNANRLLRRFPGVHHRLKLFAQNRGLMVQPMAAPGMPSASFTGVDYSRVSFAVYPKAPLLPEALYLRDQPAAGGFSSVRMTGHIEGHYSLAIVNRGLGLAMFDLLEGRLAFQPYHGKPYDNPIDIPERQKALTQSVGNTLEGELESDVLSIVHHYPMINDLQASGMRLVLFFWEETAIPFDTITFINEHFDGVIVAASFVKKVLQDSGCRLPVFVCPMGVDHIIGHDEPPIETLRPAAGKPVRFLHISSMFERKGPDVLLEGYLNAFTKQDNVELYIKTFPNPHNRVHELLAELSAGRTDLPAVVVDESPMDDKGIIGLYRSAQALVLPTRGEGFNLPAAEALALGLPVIVTGFGAHVDFCTLRTAELVPFLFAKSGSHLGSANSCWVEPDKDALGRKMREMRDKILANDAGLEQRRREGIELIRGAYTWEQSAQAVLASAQWLKNLPPAPQEKAKLVVIGPWATRCGVAEYNQSLMSEFSRSHYDITVFCDERTAPMEGVEYQPAWKLGAAKGVFDVLGNDACANADVIIVQHQPSLFPLNEEICQRLASLHAQGKVVIVELHSTQPLIADHRLSDTAIRALGRLDRIIVHKPEDLNNLLVLGLSANVMMIGLGVMSPLPAGSADGVREELGIAESDLIIACFGFILAHKGIDTLIETIRPLERATGRTVRMIGLHSILDTRSEQTLNAYRARAEELQVEHNITWITDYLPIQECLRILSAADYVIFPYKETQESASAAVTIGLATLKPVLVSPIHIFSDLAEATWRMSGSQVDDIVASIVELEESPAKAGDLVARQEQWIQDRSWGRISCRLDATVQALMFARRHLDPVIEVQREANPILMVTAPRKLLVDVSELYFRDARTGIQRVVKRVIGEFQAGEGADYQVVPVFGVSGHGYRIASNYPGANEYVASAHEKPVEYGVGDVFLGLDLSAHLFPEFNAELERMRRAGVSIHFVVYDLIPLLHPRFAYPGIDGAFTNWMRSIGRYADGVIAISAAVAVDVKHWLQQREGLKVLPSIGHFHLGADIEQATEQQGTPDLPTDLEARLNAAPTFLMVGTLEPRKGHHQTLAAFELLWAQGHDINLVLVGKEGWAVEGLTGHLRAHPELGRHLFWLEGLSDTNLTHLYASCSALIAASEAEGFGLPLIEAAQHKLPIVARDIPVFREVAGDHAYYFQGQAPEDLARAVIEWVELFENDEYPRSADMPWLRWSESAEVLKQQVLGVADHVK
ncbi:glycosyltransferase [Pseudomonas fulva]|uniref:glycosyltransferase n=1 Tax=Pseudomonas fulva TaxID=47880 RepID=UPI002DB8A2FD|nr:glycosyltransferase [Pseudomonas fulva]MEB8057685.1 glycosyltransferase [Pseudomonas fulva]